MPTNNNSTNSNPKPPIKPQGSKKGISIRNGSGSKDTSRLDDLFGRK